VIHVSMVNVIGFQAVQVGLGLGLSVVGHMQTGFGERQGLACVRNVGHVRVVGMHAHLQLVTLWLILRKECLMPLSVSVVLGLVYLCLGLHRVQVFRLPVELLIILCLREKI